MIQTLNIEAVRKSILVAVPPQRAFETFTTHIDRWWPKTHGIGATHIQESVIEGVVRGRWLQRCQDGAEVTVGHVRVWEPPKRFSVSWEINEQWKPDARLSLASIIDVKFIELSDTWTRVELKHSEFERMGEEPGEAMRQGVEEGWAALLQLYAAATRNDKKERDE